MAKKPATPKSVETLTHDEAKRKNIPSAEHQSVMQDEERQPKQLRYPRNTDLDPQLVWRGKDEQDWSDLVVHAPPLYVQEKIHPKVLIDDLLRQTQEAKAHEPGFQTGLFADFNGIPKGVDRTEFYQHDQNWSNRMILGDSLQVMASLAERDGQLKEAEVTRTAPSSQPVQGNIRHGFVYERVPHITLKSIANNAEIDVIWEKWQETLEPLRQALNKELGQDEQDLQDKGKGSGPLSSHPVHPVTPVSRKAWQEWEIPREAGAQWPDTAKKLHADWWQARIVRQQEIDKSIAAKAEFEYLYDKPYEDKKTVRVPGPFTAESLSPHRVLGVDEDDDGTVQRADLVEAARECGDAGFDVLNHLGDEVMKVFKVQRPANLSPVMSESGFRLPKAPIVEAVLDIECDLPPGQQIESLEAAARGRFQDHYPKFRTQFMQEHRIETKGGEPPKMSVRRQVQGLQFLQEDERQLVQVRGAGFSFNRLAPYGTLGDYLPEIERTWRLFIDLASPVQVRVIRLRYINRIILPMEDGRVRLDDWLKHGPHLPDEQSLILTGFLNQHAAIEKHSGHQVNILLTAQPQEETKLPIIFDNCVAAVEAGEPENWAWILSSIQALRGLKNRSFLNTLTEKCLNLFQ